MSIDNDVIVDLFVNGIMGRNCGNNLATFIMVLKHESVQIEDIEKIHERTWLLCVSYGINISFINQPANNSI